MFPAEAQKSIPIAFHRITPILRVSDLEASVNYYVGVLGFKMDWRDDDGNSFVPQCLAAIVSFFSPWAIRAIRGAGCGSV